MHWEVEEEDDSGTLYTSKLCEYLLRSNASWKTWTTTEESCMCVSDDSRFANLLWSWFTLRRNFEFFEIGYKYR